MTGQVKAGKLSERVTDSGLVGVKIGDGVAAIVEISAETDFVARSEPFQVHYYQLILFRLSMTTNRNSLVMLLQLHAQLIMIRTMHC